MPATTIHIPTSLLEVVDRRARTEGISRNRFILNALQRALAEDDAWSPARAATKGWCQGGRRDGEPHCRAPLEQTCSRAVSVERRIRILDTVTVS
ncbi:ribbon-helix-helix protein, CopG family [bacterium CPR1]|nr:ribbon-helix-helix protein, CopG family [bacterium CPR1]